MTIAEIRAAMIEAGSCWWDASNMEAFGTEAVGEVIEGPGGVYFVTRDGEFVGTDVEFLGSRTSYWKPEPNSRLGQMVRQHGASCRTSYKGREAYTVRRYLSESQEIKTTGDLAGYKTEADATAAAEQHARGSDAR
jgi:hypothetical protein